VNRKNLLLFLLLLLSYIMIGPPPKQNKYLDGNNNKYYHTNLANIRLGSSSRVIEERLNRFLILLLSYIMIAVSNQKT